MRDFLPGCTLKGNDFCGDGRCPPFSSGATFRVGSGFP